jgi:hypothetical protein
MDFKQTDFKDFLSEFKLDRDPAGFTAFDGRQYGAPEPGQLEKLKGFVKFNGSHLLKPNPILLKQAAYEMSLTKNDGVQVPLSLLEDVFKVLCALRNKKGSKIFRWDGVDQFRYTGNLDDADFGILKGNKKSTADNAQNEITKEASEDKKGEDNKIPATTQEVEEVKSEIPVEPNPEVEAKPGTEDKPVQEQSVVEEKTASPEPKKRSTRKKQAKGKSGGTETDSSK